MPTVTGAWSREEIDRFLADAVVPVRIACVRPDGTPWILSLWYRYEDGTLRCATSADADVVRFLRARPTVAFEVSTNESPYKGVRGAGEATVDDDAGKDLLRSLLERYRGGTDGPLAERLLRPEREEVRVEIAPERLHSWDYTERMAAE